MYIMYVYVVLSSWARCYSLLVIIILHIQMFEPFKYEFVFYFIAKSCMNMQTLTRENDRL